jgi:hypothetical protein
MAYIRQVMGREVFLINTIDGVRHYNGEGVILFDYIDLTLAATSKGALTKLVVSEDPTTINMGRQQ